MSPAVATATQRVAESFALRLDAPDGSTTGLVSSAAGGVISASVIRHQSGGDPFPRKILGPLRYEDITVEIGVAMPATLFDWVAGSWGTNPPSMDGALLAFDNTFTLRREQPFVDALVAETMFPTLDAASNETGRIGVRITPRELLPPVKPAAGAKLTFPLGKNAHKAWQVSAFKLLLAGLDTGKVARIDPFSVKRSIAVSSNGTTAITAGLTSFPNLRVSLAASGADSWYAWYEDFLIEGNSTDADEKEGAIVLLGPGLTPIASIKLLGVGIFRIAPMPGVARVVADLYCERMELVAGGV